MVLSENEREGTEKKGGCHEQEWAACNWNYREGADSDDAQI